MIRQYREAKERHPDVLLLFRVGDFYELYDQDAKDAAKIIGLTVTTRTDAKTKETTAMTGFTHHSLESFLHTLLKAGRRVAILEPVTEAPKSAKPERIVMRGDPTGAD